MSGLNAWWKTHVLLSDKALIVMGTLSLILLWNMLDETQISGLLYVRCIMVEYLVKYVYLTETSDGWDQKFIFG